MSKKKRKKASTPSRTEAAIPGSARRRLPIEPLVMVALFLGFWAVYYLSIGVEKPNLAWPNFVFDADPARVLDDALNGQNPAVFARHPLFALTVGSMARLFALVLDPRASVLAATSFFSALGVAASLLVFRRLCGQLLPALLFSLLYGFSATHWALSSIPETFALNSTFIVGVFLMHRPEFAQPARHQVRFGLNVIWTALAMGVAVPNIVYPALGFASNLRKAQATLVRRAAVFLFFAAATCGSLAVLGWAQRAAFPASVPEGQILTAPFRAVGNDAYLRFDRPFVPAEAGRLLRAFMADNVVAPPALIATGRVSDGPLSLIQYGGPVSGLYVIVILGLVALIGTLLWQGKPGEVMKDQSAQLALGFLVYNIIFHYFYRANGQPFIFSVHAVFPLLVLLAALSLRNAVRFRTELLALAAVLVTVNNGVFVRFVSTVLELPCDRQVGSVCLAWPGRTLDPRFTKGVAEFERSADFPLELGHVEYAQGRFEESIPLFRKALELDGHYLLVRWYLGAALIQANRIDEAIEHLTSSLERYPTEVKLTELLAEARRRRALLPPNQGRPK